MTDNPKTTAPAWDDPPATVALKQRFARLASEMERMRDATRWTCRNCGYQHNRGRNCDGCDLTKSEGDARV